MPFSRKFALTSAIATQCLVAALAGSPARADTIPSYFFKEWTVAANCAEQTTGQAASVSPGLKFQISSDSLGADGSYVFVAENIDQLQWAPDWNGIKLQYRAGTAMTTLPADFECIPGQEATSPFLAMSNYVQTAEPYYQQEHWYALATIQGQLEHVLIFPRNASTGPSAVIVMLSASSPTTAQLDDNGVIHMDQ